MARTKDLIKKSTPLDLTTCKDIKAYSKAHSWDALASQLYTTTRSLRVLAQGRMAVSARYKADIRRALNAGGLIDGKK